MTPDENLRLTLSRTEKQFVNHINRERIKLLYGMFRIPLKEPSSSGTPSQQSLNDILNNAVKIPSSTSVVTVPSSVTNPPSGVPDASILQMLRQVRTLESYI